MQYLQFQLLVELYRRISPIFKSPEIVFMDISSKTNYIRRSCCDTRFAFSVLHMQLKFLYIIYEVYASSFQFTFIV